MMKKNNAIGNVDMILSAIGNLYCLGHNPKFNVIYPAVTYPVSRGTQSISPLIGWDHSSDWLVTQYPDYFNPINTRDNTVTIDYNNEDDKKHFDHCVNGNVSMSSVGYIMMIWNYFAESIGRNFMEISVEFSNVKFHKQVNLKRPGKTIFMLNRLETGEFTIKHENIVVVTGKLTEINGFHYPMR